MAVAVYMSIEALQPRHRRQHCVRTAYSAVRIHWLVLTCHCPFYRYVYLGVTIAERHMRVCSKLVHRNVRV